LDGSCTSETELRAVTVIFILDRLRQSAFTKSVNCNRQQYLFSSNSRLELTDWIIGVSTFFSDRTRRWRPRPLAFL